MQLWRRTLTQLFDYNCIKYKLSRLVHILQECSGPYPESYKGIPDKVSFELLRDKIMQGVERELKDIRNSTPCSCEGTQHWSCIRNSTPCSCGEEHD